jgi:ABC-type transporter Mla maintaining outer membrane lipid asymmetry permease subunit MlaE
MSRRQISARVIVFVITSGAGAILTAVILASRAGSA